jgi:predicted GIY-YIG superfamily endonuclease
MITGRVYLIKGSEHWEVYIGSTTQSLQVRFKQHTKHQENKNCDSKYIINDNEVNIYLLEEGEFEDTKALRWCERKWFDRYDTINKVRPIQTAEENLETARLNRIKHRDERKAYAIQHYKDNREEIKTKKRNHHRYQTTWGGTMRSNNNLLEIDLDIFK